MNNQNHNELLSIPAIGIFLAIVFFIKGSIIFGAIILLASIIIFSIICILIRVNEDAKKANQVENIIDYNNRHNKMTSSDEDDDELFDIDEEEPKPDFHNKMARMYLIKNNLKYKKDIDFEDIIIQNEMLPGTDKLNDAEMFYLYDKLKKEKSKNSKKKY